MELTSRQTYELLISDTTREIDQGLLYLKDHGNLANDEINTALFCLSYFFTKNVFVVQTSYELWLKHSANVDIIVDLKEYRLPENCSETEVFHLFCQVIHLPHVHYETLTMFLKRVYGNVKTLCFDNPESALLTMPALLLEPGIFDNLEELTIEKQLIRKVPAGIGWLKNLRKLSLINCAINEISEQIGQLTNLEELHLQHNQLTKINYSIVQLPRLKYVNIGYNLLTIIPQAFGTSAIELVGWTNPFLYLPDKVLVRMRTDYTQWLNQKTTHETNEVDAAYVLFLTILYTEAIPQSFNPLPEINRWLEKVLLFEKEAHNDYEKLLMMEYLAVTEYSVDSNTLCQMNAAVMSRIEEVPGKFDPEIKHLSLHLLDTIHKHSLVLPLTQNLTIAGELGEVPHWIDRLTRLETLFVNNTRMTELPEMVLELKELRIISLSGNQIKKVPDNWQALQKLHTLDLSNNRLMYLPESIGELPALENLEINHNLLGVLPEYLKKFELRKGFVFNNARIAPKGLKKQGYKELKEQEGEALTDCQRTQLFCLGYLHADKQIRTEALKQWKLRLAAEEVKLLPNWRYSENINYVNFLLLYNKSKEVYPDLNWLIIEGWIYYTGLKSRKRIDLSGLSIDKIPHFYFRYWVHPRVNLSGNLFEEIPAAVKVLTNVLTLNMSHNLLDSLPEDEFFYWHPVKELNLSHNAFEYVPVALQNLVKLESLDMSHNQLGSVFDENSFELPKLKKLNLSFNNLQNASREIANLKSLQELDLSYNDLCGNLALPLEISYLDELTHLYLHHNMLQSLPPGIGLVEQLKVLDCSHNKFEEIPREVFESETLEVLDFSYNQITQIPTDITDLPELKKVILTGNPLQENEQRKAKRLLKEVEWVFYDELPEVTLPKVARTGTAVQSLVKKGDTFYNKQDYDQAAGYYFKAAAQGYVQAINNLGYLYLYGDLNYPKAVYWYGRSARQGNSQGMLNLGWMYNNGLGIAENLTKATYWYEKAAIGGLASGQYNTGLMYQYGRGVEPNNRRAAYWYEKAAEQGHAAAQVNIGWMYNNGKGVSVNKSKAAEWYEKAAEKGHLNGQKNLAYMLREGVGLPKDEKKAFYWYKKAAAQNDAGALVNLGWMYEQGKGTKKNVHQAFQHYKKSAEQGYSAAQYNVGIMYQYGKGLTVNLEEAFGWYSKAAKQGYADAQKKLVEMYSHGLGVKKSKHEANRWSNTYNKTVAEEAKKNS